MSPTKRSRCRAHRATLDAVLDGRERLAALQSLELHAESCDSCARALEESRALRAALDDLPAPTFDRASDDAFVAGVLGRLDDAVDLPLAPGRRPVLRLASALAAAAAVAAVFVVGRSALERDDEVAVDDATTAAADAGSESTSAPIEAEVAEPVAPAASLPPVVDETPEAASVDALALALDECADELEFDPRGPASGAAFARAVRARVDGDVAWAARAIVRDPDDAPRAALAARLLGVGADYRDREVLVDAIGTIGAPAALALGDRGGPGIERLWRVAAEDGEVGESAREALRDLVVLGDPARDPSRRVPRALPVALVAPIVAASPGSGADVALDRYLETGDDAWLTALLEHPELDAAVEALFGHGVRSRDRDLALDLVRRGRLDSGLEFVVECLELGVDGAARTLAALPGDAPMERLVELSRSGRLRDASEEAAWRALAHESSARVAAVTERWSREVGREDDVELVVDALVRADVDDRSLLVRLAALDAVGGRNRVTALLHLASAEAVAAPLSAEDATRLEALRGSRDVDVAAAAWMVPTEGTEPPPSLVAAALERGGDPAVRLVRVSRALARERARSERRAGRADATP